MQHSTTHTQHKKPTTNVYIRSHVRLLFPSPCRLSHAPAAPAVKPRRYPTKATQCSSCLRPRHVFIATNLVTRRRTVPPRTPEHGAPLPLEGTSCRCTSPPRGTRRTSESQTRTPCGRRTARGSCSTCASLAGAWKAGRGGCGRAAGGGEPCTVIRLLFEDGRALARRTPSAK